MNTFRGVVRRNQVAKARFMPHEQNESSVILSIGLGDATGEASANMDVENPVAFTEVELLLESSGVLRVLATMANDSESGQLTVTFGEKVKFDQTITGTDTYTWLVL